MRLTSVFLPHSETFSGIFIQGICISSWPLKVLPRAVLFGMFIKMYIKCGCHGNIFFLNQQEYESDPCWTLMYSMCKAKCPRHSVKVYSSNILYIFT